MSYRTTPPSPAKLAAGVLGALVVVFAGIVPLFGYLTGFTKADGGHVVVVRNGGPFDDNSIRQVIQPNSGLTSTGLWSSEHPYPSTQRNFKISGSENADSNEVINVPTKDGVLVGVEGTFYFDVNYTDEKTMRTFDDKYGTRTYPHANGDALYAWQDEDGWNAYLSFTLGNLVQNVMRQEIGNAECAALVASCALAQNTNAQAAPLVPNATSNDTISRIQDAVNTGFTKDVDSVLGVPIFVHPRFVLSKVDLPPNVQKAINDTQAVFAGVTQSRAALQRAQIDAETNRQRQAGYTVCSACAVIDELHALPPSITTFAPGQGFAITGK
jgi:hypothetical protein